MTPDIADIGWALVPLTVWAGFVIIDRTEPWPARVLARWAAFYAVLAAILMTADTRPLTMSADAAFAAWCAYHAWKRRKPRQRKPSKTAARVRNLGHRLKVTHT